MLGIGATCGAQAAEETPFDRGRVRRLIAVRGPELEVRVGGAGGAASLVGERQRTLEVLAEDGIQLRGRRPADEVGPRLPEVVLGGHRTLLKQHVDPDRRGGEPIRCRVCGIDGDRLAKGRERRVTIEVVAQGLAARAKRRTVARAGSSGRPVGMRRRRLARREAHRRQRRGAEDHHRRAQTAPRHHTPLCRPA